jgi:NhaP-type Na+/H+ or K+/H+ antiporter
MTHTAIYQAALVIAFGMAAQAFAVRFKVPSIIILLATGVAVGPDGLGLIDPDALESARPDLVTLAVTVILFEGGLALRLEDLRSQQRSLGLLLTLGAAISMFAGTAAARYVLGMPWSLAVLFGALVIVSGPTVVTPLLSRLTLDRTVRELLISEGVLIDPVGAIVAIVALDYVVWRPEVWQAGWLVFVRLSVGALVGALAGIASTAVLRRRWVADELRNPVVFATVLLAAMLASSLSSEAGLLAAVVQGVVMANAGLRELGPLRRFKEELTVLLLSFVFVLLAASLSIDAVRGLGWQALLVVGILMWVARPFAVFVCTFGSTLTIRQRLFVSWICPRGIVAAAVAGLFGILLGNAGIAGGNQLEALVFVTVAVTVAVQGLTAGSIAALLRVDLPSAQGTIIIGADYLGRLLAELLQTYGRQVVLMDVNLQYCRAAHAQGLTAYCGDALSADSLEEAGARYADTVAALTRNQELNTLIAQRIRDNFRAERILALAEDSVAKGERPLFPGDFPGADEVNRQLRVEHARLMQCEVPAGEWENRPLGELPYGTGEFALLLLRRDQGYVATRDQTLAAGDQVFCLLTSDGVSGLATHFTVIRDAAVRGPLRLAKPH